jgi:hypothetical protein
MTRAISVVIVDDEPLARQKLRRLFEAAPGFEVVGEAGDGEGRSASSPRRGRRWSASTSVCWPSGLDVAQGERPAVSSRRHDQYRRQRLRAGRP